MYVSLSLQTIHHNIEQQQDIANSLRLVCKLLPRLSLAGTASSKPCSSCTYSTPLPEVVAEVSAASKSKGQSILSMPHYTSLDLGCKDSPNLWAQI